MTFWSYADSLYGNWPYATTAAEPLAHNGHLTAHSVGSHNASVSNRKGFRDCYRTLITALVLGSLGSCFLVLAIAKLSHAADTTTSLHQVESTTQQVSN